MGVVQRFIGELASPAQGTDARSRIPSRLAPYLELFKSESGGGVNYGAAGGYLARQAKVASNYIANAWDAVRYNTREALANSRRRGALGLAGLAGLAALGILAAYPPAITVGQTVPDTPPGAGQAQPPADEQQPMPRSQTVQEEGTIFPCAKTGEIWDAQNPKFKELFLGPRRQRVLKFSSHAEPYVKAVESGETAATCTGYDISFPRRGQKPFPLRAVGPDGELLMNINKNAYDPNSPKSLDVYLTVTVHRIKGLEGVNLPIDEKRSNLLINKFDPPAQGRWNVTIGGRRYETAEWAIGVWFDPKTSNDFDFSIWYFKSETTPPVQGFKGHSNSGKKFKERFDKSRIFGDNIWEIIDKMNKGKYYDRHLDEFKH